MEQLVDVTGVDVIGEYRLRLSFEDGTIGDVDFVGRDWNGVFEPLRDPAYFARVEVDPEAGTITWPGGLDMAPEPLYAAARRHPVSRTRAATRRAHRLQGRDDPPLAVTPDQPLTLRQALRQATPQMIDPGIIDDCLSTKRDRFDALFRRARAEGLSSLDRSERSGHLWRVVGEVAESVAEVVLDEIGYSVFWHVTDPGVHGVDLLFLSPDESILALEVKGTLRPGTIPRLTPSRFRQMSRDWLSQPDNPAMTEWALQADDLYAGVMVVDLATPTYRIALSGDFDSYVPVRELAQPSTRAARAARAARARFAARARRRRQHVTPRTRRVRGMPHQQVNRPG